MKIYTKSSVLSLQKLNEDIHQEFRAENLKLNEDTGQHYEFSVEH